MTRFILIIALWFATHAVIMAADRYVSLDGANDTAGGYTNWVGAATQVHWAVSAAAAGETIWISNGTYYLTNYVLVTNLTIRSLNGPGCNYT